MRRFIVCTPKPLWLSFVLACSACTSVLAQATNDGPFLACAEHSDRGQRIACLEDALERAVAARQETPTTSVVGNNANAETPQAAAPSQAAPAADEPRERSLLDRVRSFGQPATVSEDASGAERLHDTISALEKRNGLWIITLASGQVWRQEVARTLNLRVGDDIDIYQEGIGNGYRLATPRLSGFIRVERAR